MQTHMHLRYRLGKANAETGYYSYYHRLLPTVHKKISNTFWTMPTLPFKINRTFSTTAQDVMSYNELQWGLTFSQ
eukprot:1148147-Pelagomonas_calceolata.AAC.1